MISIIFSTNRHDPKINWFIDSFLNQTTKEDRENLEIIIVDAAKENRPLEHIPNMLLRDLKDVQHALPKPNLYQGVARKTKGEYFSPANARNTGIILSSGDYLVFVDDLAVLMPNWWASVKRAARENKIVCGSYQKHFEMVVENGVLVSSRYHEKGNDSRWGQGNDNHAVRIEGTQLFGCSLGIPAQDIIDVNGFDELCDTIGGEDYHLGVRLNHAGKKIYYDRSMLTIESEELHSQPYLMQREDRVLSAESYMERLSKFGITKRKVQGNNDSSHMVIDVLYGMNQTRAIFNNFDIGKCRMEKKFAELPFENYHWFDMKPLNEMN